jgi:hypothetical protein
MPIFLDREQRDAIRRALLINLSGTGDIHIEIMNRDWARARRFRMEFEDDMRLLDDLGWGDDEPGERFEITMEPTQLRRLITRLHHLATTELQQYLSRPLDDEEDARAAPRRASASARSLASFRASTMADTAEITATVPASVAHGVLDLAFFKRDERGCWVAPDGRRTWAGDEALGWALRRLATDSEAVLAISLLVWRRKASRSEAQRAVEATRPDPGAALVADFVAILKDVFDSGLPTDTEAWDLDARAILDRLLPLVSGS